ncbi:MAG: serine O-acetyltransferase [Acidimicrobiia bacterium]
MYADLREDLVVLRRNTTSGRSTLALMLTNRGIGALACYRAAVALRRRQIPLAPLVLLRVCQHRYGVDIDHRADLRPGINLVHGFGIVIGAHTVVNHGCTLFHGVTLGNRMSKQVGSMREDGCPTLENDVLVCAGAKVLGKIVIGEGSVIAANAVVTESVPARSLVVGNPGRVIRTLDRPPF